MAEVQVDKDEQGSRYEASIGGDVVGYVEYVTDGDTVELTHTVVEDAAQGQGVGSALAQAALEDIRAQRKIVRPTCSFIRRYIDTHPQFAAFVAGGGTQPPERGGFSGGGSF